MCLCSQPFFFLVFTVRELCRKNVPKCHRFIHCTIIALAVVTFFLSLSPSLSLFLSSP